jgi:hypothetical protein
MTHQAQWAPVSDNHGWPTVITFANHGELPWPLQSSCNCSCDQIVAAIRQPGSATYHAMHDLPCGSTLCYITCMLLSNPCPATPEITAGYLLT